MLNRAVCERNLVLTLVRLSLPSRYDHGDWKCVLRRGLGLKSHAQKNKTPAIMNLRQQQTPETVRLRPLDCHASIGLAARIADEAQPFAVINRVHTAARNRCSARANTTSRRPHHVPLVTCRSDRNGVAVHGKRKPPIFDKTEFKHNEPCQKYLGEYVGHDH